MAFTYDPTLDTDLDKVRFTIGDTATPNHLIEDAEITAMLASAGSVNVASYKICHHIAAKFARQADFSMDEQGVKLSQKSAAYEKLAARIKEDSVDGGLQTIVTTKIDGYQPTNDEKSATDRVNNTMHDFDAGRFRG